MISISKAPNAKMQVLSGNGCCLCCWQIEMEMSSYLSLNKALPFSLAHHHSCFLLCKQLVQAVHPIPPVFLKVKHHQTVPFWRHEKLIPLIPLETGMEIPIVMNIWRVVENAEDRNEFKDEEFNDELDSNIIDTASSAIVTGMMFDEHVEEQVELLQNFADGLKYQTQFGNTCMLDWMEREGATLFRFVESCLSHECCMNSMGGSSPTIWEKATSTSMF